jgi:hypothetical protein
MTNAKHMFLSFSFIAWGIVSSAYGQCPYAVPTDAKLATAQRGRESAIKTIADVDFQAKHLADGAARAKCIAEQRTTTKKSTVILLNQSNLDTLRKVRGNLPKCTGAMCPPCGIDLETIECSNDKPYPKTDPAKLATFKAGWSCAAPASMKTFVAISSTDHIKLHHLGDSSEPVKLQQGWPNPSPACVVTEPEQASKSKIVNKK